MTANYCQGKIVLATVMLIQKHLYFYTLSEQSPIIAIIINKRKKIKEKTKKVRSIDKTLVGTDELAGTVIQKCSTYKPFLENYAKFTGKYLCWSLFLMKFQILKSVTLSKSDSCKGICL